MEIVEEIRKLKSLLDEGKITGEEFRNRKSEILSQSTNEDKTAGTGQQQTAAETAEKPVTAADNTNQEKPSGNPAEEMTGTMSSSPENEQISPDHVVAAGRAIQSSVRLLVVSYIMNFVGIFLLFYSLVFEIMSGIMSGDDILEIYGDSGALIIGSFLMFLGIIFWIKYVLRLNKAGRILKTSSEAAGYLAAEPKKQRPRVERKPNPIAIIASIVAAIIVLFPLIFHSGRFATLPNSILLALVAIAGGVLAFYNLKWSFLAGAFNAFMGIIALIARFGYYTADYAGQFFMNALPIPLIFIIASVVFIIATARYLKATQ